MLALQGGDFTLPLCREAQTAHLESFQRLSTEEQWNWLGLNFVVQIRVCVGICLCWVINCTDEISDSRVGGGLWELGVCECHPLQCHISQGC